MMYEFSEIENDISINEKLQIKPVITTKKLPKIISSEANQALPTIDNSNNSNNTNNSNVNSNNNSSNNNSSKNEKKNSKLKNTSTSRKKHMLTSSQLSDLFRRLDKDGNGELNMEEFLELSIKLKLDAPEEYIASIFREVDTAKSGTLSMQEFICAYQMVYSSSLTGKYASTSKKLSEEETEYVRATRYGHNKKGEYIFEVYGGSPNNMNEKICYLIEDEMSFITRLKSGILDTEWKGNIDIINEMVVQDSIRNKKNQTIFWWIDISMLKVESSRVDKYISGFGLPNDKRFRSSFSMFGNQLPLDRSSRIYAGNGGTKLGGCSSLSLYIQSMWIKGRPLVHNLPAWMDTKDLKGPLADLREYYGSRLAFIATDTERACKTNLKEELMTAYHSSESMAERLKDNIDEESDEENEYHTHLDHLDIRTGNSIPFFHDVKIRPNQPSWLLNNKDLKKFPPGLQLDTVSIHLIDQGHGTSCCITVREIDCEENIKLLLERKTRTGVVGRIMSGVWMKIFEVICQRGTAVIAGELDDCPGALASFIISLIHSFNMNTIGSCDQWIDRLHEEAIDIAVSKHMSHTKEIFKMIQSLRHYVEPFENVIKELFDDAVIKKSENIGKKVFKNVPKGKENDLSHAILPDGVESLPVTFELIESFIGLDPVNYLGTILDGEEMLEVKGLGYWLRNLKAHEETVAIVKSDVQDSLEEKRNFYSFLLTVVTIFLAPVAILTGYWGMNFDNMEELSSETYTYFPGVKLLWFVGLIIYSLFMTVAIHHRILYSAT